MPRIDFTDITIILDRSGSMASVAHDTIGGFNRFVEDQKGGHGEAALTLVQFDNQYEVVYAGTPIADVPVMTGETFVPRGSTALLDAIGRTIDDTGRRLASLPEAQRPETVIIVIITDGYENASRRYTSHRVGEMIAHQSDIYSWQFVFLGANQDAIATAASMGVDAGSALTYAATPIGTENAFAAVSSRTRVKRVMKDRLTKEQFFEESNRAAQADELRRTGR
jgi:hypothetical protein